MLFSLFLIVVSVEGLVSGAIGLGEIFSTPSFLWGITVIAAATSLPDAFVSIRAAQRGDGIRSEEHTSELQSQFRISYAVFCLKKKKNEKKPWHQANRRRQHD